MARRTGKHRKIKRRTRKVKGGNTEINNAINLFETNVKWNTGYKIGMGSKYPESSRSLNKSITEGILPEINTRPKGKAFNVEPLIQEVKYLFEDYDNIKKAIINTNDSNVIDYLFPALIGCIEMIHKKMSEEIVRLLTDFPGYLKYISESIARIKNFVGPLRALNKQTTCDTKTTYELFVEYQKNKNISNFFEQCKKGIKKE